MKLTIFTKYGNLAATTRQRFEQYKPYLEERGFDVSIYPLLNNEYLEKLYSTGKHNPRDVFASYLKRLKFFLKKPDTDIVWLNYELFPYMPGFFESILSSLNKPIIYDIDDAIFHNYDLNNKWVLRYFLKNKLHVPIKKSKIAFCGNEYLAKYALSLDVHTEIVPTTLDTSRFIPITKTDCDNQAKIGWIGSPSTWNDYLIDILPTLKDCALEHDAKIAIMGAENNAVSDSIIEITSWDENKEVAFLQSLDIGIMPLKDNPWSRGKCGYKLIQYMACGIPVIASPVGINCKIVDHGINGFLVNDKSEWKEAITTLLNDSDLRYEMGIAGRKKIEQEFCINIWGPNIATIIENTIEGK